MQPWFTWFSASHTTIPDGVQIADGMFNDHSCLRVLFGGFWTAMTADGPMEFDPGEQGMTLYFGPHSKVMPITVRGEFKVITVHLAPGAGSVMGGPRQVDMIDRIVDQDENAGRGQFSSRFDPDAGPQEWLAVFERELAKFLEVNRTSRPDDLTLAFEQCTLVDPSFSLARFAEEQGVASRTVERTIQRDYGLSPKQVQRRARALDLVAALLGVAMEEEEAALRLRYFDQSHQNREIRHFFDTTPGKLAAGAHPLLRLSLETRQARRLAAIDAKPLGALPPWRDPGAEPAQKQGEA
ncbi:helix-turn-helix domain-containing protein [Qipengyuania zhejiangensis]|uniref:helix-turn-helix domain-containing protein n=1 Tax=Qipengyuania zhejiangensis TaxID=3077782 RepID=UPI002D7654A9|nr:AraC family transcriptional regulator [Qipengyuania sp. Z2]